MKRIFKLLKKTLTTLWQKLNRFGNGIKYGVKIKKELELNPQPKLTRVQKKEVKSFFSYYGFTNIRYLWHEYYGGLYGRFDKNFIPQDLFFSRIEHALNKVEYSRLQDKNLLDILFSNVRQPKTYIKNINGFYQKNNKIITKEEAISEIKPNIDLIIKPSVDTWGGNGVVRFRTNGKETNFNGKSLNQLLDSYKEDFIVQEALNQSEKMDKLNPSSLNTIRIATYLRKDEVQVLFAIVRFGTMGAIKDNISSGGYYSKILPNGFLNYQAFNTEKQSIEIVEEGTVLKDFQVPNYDKVKNTVMTLHHQVPYFKLISWDIGLDKEDEPVLIEYNCHGQSIDFQAVNGPLFGEFTEEILESAAKFVE